MFGLGILKKIFDSNEKEVKKLQKIVDKVNALEPTVTNLTDEELKARTAKFKEQIQGGATLDDILTEAFATVREAAKRVRGERHYDVQIIGGLVLHKIAEMKTGEGKTLVAVSPLYLNGFGGQRGPPGHGQRLSGQARRHVDGPHLRFPRPDHRRDQSR